MGGGGQLSLMPEGSVGGGGGGWAEIILIVTYPSLEGH